MKGFIKKIYYHDTDCAGVVRQNILTGEDPLI